MTPQDERTVREWAARRQVATTILLARGQGAGDERMALFGERLAALAPTVRIEQADEAFRSPALIIGKHQNIAYQAVPEGRELALFLEALADVVQVLGQIKGGAATPYLKKIASGDFAEAVRQAAAEELDGT